MHVFLGDMWIVAYLYFWKPYKELTVKDNGLSLLVNKYAIWRWADEVHFLSEIRWNVFV